MRPMRWLLLVWLSGCAHRSFPPPPRWDDVRVTVTESSALEATAAIAAAWKGAALTPEGEPIRRPASRGWKEEVSADFTTPTSRVHAEVRSFGGRTWVVLAEGDAASLDKRQAQLEAIVAGLHPDGMHPESFAGRTPRALDQAALDAFLIDALARLEVPGAAVAIVQRGKVIYERSLGVRALGRAEPVDADTLFLMASVTKPMTTFLQASLVDAGLFTFDTPVTTLLPGFALGDPALTGQLALWHMSCACTGMPRRDLENLVEYGGVTAEQRLASLREMKPTTGLGETFQYSNLMVAAGGFAAAHAFAPALSLNDAYVQAMAERVFGPLGMRSSTADFARAVSGPHAAPHALDLEGRPHELAIGFEGNVVPIAPAGAVWSTLHDMEKYALAELGHGVAADGKRVVSEAQFAQRWQRRIGDAASGYGLGIDLEQRSGLSVVGHDGGADGFGTSLFLVPELDLGLIVLTNIRNGTGEEQLPFNAAVKRKLLELSFEGASPEAEVMIEFALRMRRDSVRQQSAGVERAPDAAWVQSISGRYSSPLLGRLVISPAAQGATFDVGEWQVTVGRRRHADGSSELVVLDAPFAGTPMAIGPDGSIRLPDPQTEYVFTRDR